MATDKPQTRTLGGHFQQCLCCMPWQAAVLVILKGELLHCFTGYVCLHVWQFHLVCDVLCDRQPREGFLRVMHGPPVGSYLFGSSMQQADKDIYKHGVLRKVS